MKIAIITFNKAINYGALLQTLALEKCMSQEVENNSVYVLNYNNVEMAKVYSIYRKILTSNSLKNLLLQLYLSPSYLIKKYSFKQFEKKINYMPFEERNQCDIFVTGSDQVFNINIARTDETYFLPVSKFGIKKKYSYSASFGKVENYLLNKTKIDTYLKSFSTLSFREKDILPVINKNFKNVRFDLDPTLLFDSNFWDKYCSLRYKKKKPYILIYNIVSPDKLILFAKKMSLKTNLDIIQIDGPVIHKNGIKSIRGVSPAGFLSLIKNAEYVLTTSFHGTAFSIIYKKKFFVEVGRDEEKNERIDNILSLLNLEKRNISKFENQSYEDSIDYLKVEEILNKERKKSITYLSDIVNQVEIK